jgi:uncharacterized protein (TIGR00159 family)
MTPFADLADLRWQDAVDVALLTLVLFRLYVWLRGTVALQIALGMLTLALASYLASAFGFVLSAYVLQAVGAVAVLVAVVIFREEIRRALTRASPLALLLRRKVPEERRDFTVLAEALFALAKHHLGALVVVPRRDRLDEHVTGGTPIGGALTAQLVEALFQKSSPLHDGAVILDGQRVKTAGAFLPLARAELPGRYGTRHSAAVGLTEVSDALVIVVSEERGEVSLAENGALTRVPDASALARLLGERALPAAAQPAPRATAVKDGAVAAVIFVGVVAAWNVVANQAGAVEERAVPVELHGVQPGLSVEPLPAEVTLKLRGPRRLLVGVTAGDLHAWADASAARTSIDVPVSGLAPPGLQVVGVTPPRITVLERKALRVDVQLASRTARVVRVDPPEVTLVGKLGAFKGLQAVKTLPVAPGDPPLELVTATIVVPAGLRLADGGGATVTVVLAPLR